MCIGRPKPAPIPIPAPSPRPPAVGNTQSSPTSAEGTGSRRSGNVETARKGRKILRIPLISGSGTGVQIKS